MIIIYALYCLAILCHMEALRCGLTTVHKFSVMFVNSHWTEFFSSKLERQYWIITLSSVANVFLLISLPRYLSDGIGNMPFSLELSFTIFHLCESTAVMLWHHMTYKELSDNVPKTSRKVR